MTPVQILALSKLDYSAEVRDLVEDDATYPVDFMVRVFGEMRIRKGGAAVPTSAAVPWKRICAVLFSKINEATLEAVVRDAMGVEAAEAQILDAQATERAQAAVDKIQEPTKQARRGAVMVGGLQIEPVQWAEPAKEVA